MINFYERGRKTPSLFFVDMDYTQNPNYQKALEFIKNNDLNSLEVGKHVIDGDNLWVNIQECSLRKASEAKYEVHDKYIDIQIPLNMDEEYGVMPRTMCQNPDGEMDTEKDYLLFSDPVGATMTVEKGKMIVFAPDTAHAPLIGEGIIHKAVFKVKVV